MQTRTCKFIVARLFILASTLTVPEGQTNAADAPARSDPPATHNMLVVGDGPIFLSHLPMFGHDSPHRYQLILQAGFSKDGKSLDEVYAADRKSHPQTKMYTLSPKEKFALPELFNGNPPAMHSFFDARQK